MMQKTASVVVVAAAGRLRDAWQALLLAAPQIGAVYTADAQSALMAVACYTPDLVLVDAAALHDAGWPLIRKARSLRPGCSSIAVVASGRQKDEALDAGCDAVLVQGFSAEELFAALAALPQ